MLIVTPRHTQADLVEWSRLQRADRVLGQAVDWKRRQDRAILLMERFGADYCSTSWGKDSVVIAHLCWLWLQRGGSPPPLVYWSQDPRDSPEVPMVRDAFLERFPGLQYIETKVPMRPTPEGEWERVHKTSSFLRRPPGIGPRSITGVRGAESLTRKKRVRAGLTMPNTVAPIGHWSTPEVFAYLTHFDLPIHPAYAYLGGKAWDRDRLRVHSLFGKQGVEFGRRAWELQYYSDVYHELREKALEATCPQ